MLEGTHAAAGAASGAAAIGSLARPQNSRQRVASRRWFSSFQEKRKPMPTKNWYASVHSSIIYNRQQGTELSVHPLRRG